MTNEEKIRNLPVKELARMLIKESKSHTMEGTDYSYYAPFPGAYPKWTPEEAVEETIKWLKEEYRESAWKVGIV